MHSSFQQKPTWEIYHQICFRTDDSSDEQWQQALTSHRPNLSETNLDQDWSVWCETLQRIHNPNGSVIGLQPRFRLRDQFKHSKLHEQLSQAITSQNWQLHTATLQKLQQITKNQLRKWRQRIQKKGQSQHEWTKSRLNVFSNGPKLHLRRYRLVSLVTNMERMVLPLVYKIR